jgi:predicted DNA-binding transcriptional regulator YafY
MGMLPKNKDYDRKILRIWAILNKLDTGRRVASKDLAEDFNVSQRTVQRDLELLIQVGFPIYVPEKGYHSFMSDFSLKRVELSEEEASLLSFLYEIAQSLGENFEDSFKGILKKVLSKNADSPFYIKMPTGLRLKKEFPSVGKVQLAIEESRKLEILYQKKDDEEKSYLVHPFKLIQFEGFWYLLCRVDEKGHIIKLRIDRIKDLKLTDDYFDEPENLKTLLDESVNIWFDEGREEVITLRIDKDAATYFKQNKYFPLQKVKKENKDGSLVMETTVCHHMEAIPNILRWMPHVKVTAPKALKDEIADRIKRYTE